jgi:hypothetical protein
MMKTFEKVVKGQKLVTRVTNLLIRRSQWFSVEPLPDNQWAVRVKAENEVLLEAACAACQPPTFETAPSPRALRV